MAAGPVENTPPVFQTGLNRSKAALAFTLRKILITVSMVFH